MYLPRSKEQKYSHDYAIAHTCITVGCIFVNSNIEIDSLSCLIEKCPYCNLTMQFLKLFQGGKIANSMFRFFAMSEEKLSVHSGLEMGLNFLKSNARNL